MVGLLLLLSDGVVEGDNVLDSDPVADTELVMERGPLRDAVRVGVELLVTVTDGDVDKEAVGVDDAPLLPVMLGVTLMAALLL